MLKLYHNPLSPNSRRVWIALLEKGVEFELVELQLNGDQFAPEFLAISPFHHIPAIAEGEFWLVESQAILDYLEAAYPTPALVPKDPQAFGQVQMVRMVTVNELSNAIRPFVMRAMGMGNPDAKALEQSQQQTAIVLAFYERLLGNRPFLGGDSLSLADITAGVAVPWLPEMGMALDAFPQVQAWCDRLQARPSWQATKAPSDLWKIMAERIRARTA